VRYFVAAAIVAAALAVAGCGGGSSPAASAGGNGEAAKSAQQIFADTVRAAKGASSFHMSGQISTGGQQIALDLSIAKGKGAQGSITLKGQKVDLIVVGKDAYMKAGPAFWTQFGGSAGSTIAQMLAGKWVKFPAANPQFAGFSAFTSSSLFDKLSSSHGTLSKKGATTYQGQSVVAILDSSKTGGTLYVAGTGTPYPVAIKGTGSSTQGAISFDKWGQPVSLTAPSGALDFSSLGG